jgi:Arc/MetJ-type ribon-helix-helix transcriptional regulator
MGAAGCSRSPTLERLPARKETTTMYKLLIGAGALLMVTATIPASAHDWEGDNSYGYNSYNGYGGSYYGRRYGGGDYYDIVRQHVRACRAHERLHEALDAAHDQAHDEGFDSSDEHADVHDALDEAHDEYHANRPEVQHCGFWYSQYYSMNHRYYRPYGGSHRSYSYGY